MTPRLPIAQTAQQLTRDAKLSRILREISAAGEFRPVTCGQLVSDNGMDVPLSVHRPTFFRLIARIVLMCAEFKVRGIDAAWVVASVHNNLRAILGDRTEVQGVAHAVRSLHLRFPILAHADAAISFGVFRRNPFPAIIRSRLANLCPKAIFQSVVHCWIVPESKGFCYGR